MEGLILAKSEPSILTRLRKGFNRYRRISIEGNFKKKEDGYVGRIQVRCEGKPKLSFEVKVPYSFPLGNSSGYCIQFSSPKLVGMYHVVLGSPKGILSVRSEPSSDFDTKLGLEIEVMFDWVDKFYVREETPDSYWPVVDHDKDLKQFFFTQIEKEIEIGKFGFFSFSIGWEFPFPIIDKIGDGTCQWEEFAKRGFLNLGVWLYLDSAPFIKNGIVPGNWVDLFEILQVDFLEYLVSFRVSETFKEAENLPILFGYPIPYGKSKGKVGWIQTQLPMNNFPLRVSKDHQGEIFEADPFALKWGQCYDCSKEYFFGRGSLIPSLTESKILLFGCGAVGSTLATNLVRSGVNDLTLMDNDQVEPGNLSRSEYELWDVAFPTKSMALLAKLQRISPFLKGEHPGEFSKQLDPITRSIANKDLQKFDVIFDCSANPELSYWLDRISPNSLVINLSITDGAHDLICISGKSISHRKDALSEFLHKDAELKAWGDGCKQPTFSARGFEVAGLVCQAISIIEQELAIQGSVSSFLLSRTEDGSIVRSNL